MKSDAPSTLRDFDIRRIFVPDEVSQIKLLQKNASEFRQHFPAHQNWLDMALSEVVKGNRIAFGVYKLGFSARHRPTVDLVGSILIRLGLFSGTAEWKNLYIRPDARRSGYGTALCRQVEEYCAKAGYSVVETEVPSEEVNTVSFMHRMGFRVVEMKKSPYVVDEYLYRMEKVLFPFFVGDYFDFFDVVTWLANSYYALWKVRAVREESQIEFAIRDSSNLANIVKPSDLSLKGRISVFEDIGEEEEAELIASLDNQDYHLQVVFADSFSADFRESCSRRRIKLIDRQMVYEAFSHLFAYKPACFEKKDIAGMIVAINPEYFGRLANGSMTSFSYFKTGPIGQYLKEGDRLLIYSEPTPDSPDGGIRGMGEVLEVYCDNPSNVWNSLRDKNPLFGQEEFIRFARNKKSIVGFYVRDFRTVRTISFWELAEKVIGQAYELPDLGHCYIDRHMLANVLSLVEKGASQPISDVWSTEELGRRKKELEDLLEARYNDLLGGLKKELYDDKRAIDLNTKIGDDEKRRIKRKFEEGFRQRVSALDAEVDRVRRELADMRGIQDHESMLSRINRFGQPR